MQGCESGPYVFVFEVVAGKYMKLGCKVSNFLKVFDQPSGVYQRSIFH